MTARSNPTEDAIRAISDYIRETFGYSIAHLHCCKPRDRAKYVASFSVGDGVVFTRWNKRRTKALRRAFQDALEWVFFEEVKKRFSNIPRPRPYWQADEQGPRRWKVSVGILEDGTHTHIAHGWGTSEGAALGHAISQVGHRFPELAEPVFSAGTEYFMIHGKSRSRDSRRRRRQ
jgi:hypothetical protein